MVPWDHSQPKVQSLASEEGGGGGGGDGPNN